MNNRQEILRQLKESGDFVSGQQLCDLLGISRTAVWKNIEKLREEGYPIEAVTSRGYRLLPTEDSDLLNYEELAGRLHTKWVGHPLIYKAETGSTNNDILALSDQGSPEGTLVVASRQTAGKGRRGRAWISPSEGNIYMSILLRPQMKADIVSMVTLIMALSVYQAALELEAAEGVDCRFGIKWPNDIVASVNGGSYRKLCGILTEMRMEEMDIRDVVIGTGLNVNEKHFSKEIQETATSFCLALGHDVNRALLTARTWDYFEEDYDKFRKAQSLSPLKDIYESGLVNRGRLVRVLDPRTPFTGTAEGITDTGELIVRPQDGSEEKFVRTGEVSVRGVMGYV